MAGAAAATRAEAAVMAGVHDDRYQSWLGRKASAAVEARRQRSALSGSLRSLSRCRGAGFARLPCLVPLRRVPRDHGSQDHASRPAWAASVTTACLPQSHRCPPPGASAVTVAGTASAAHASDEPPPCRRRLPSAMPPRPIPGPGRTARPGPTWDLGRRDPRLEAAAASAEAARVACRGRVVVVVGGVRPG
jgi:hypothetical protein